MTCPAVAARGRDAAVQAYEQLRGRTFADTSSGNHGGLVVLLREGLAAWLSHNPSGAVMPAARPSCPSAAKAAPLLSEPINVDLVRVLASMTLANLHKEISA